MTRVIRVHLPENIEKKISTDHSREAQKDRLLEEGGGIVFNFDNADLYEVIRTMADMLNINYIIEPNVSGKVTIHTAGTLKKSELLSVFSRILEANGLSAVKDEKGSLYSIVKMKEAARLPLMIQAGNDAAALPSGERVIMQIISLDYMNAEQMSKLINPFISSDGTLLVHQESNTLLMVDKSDNISKALRMVETFDVDIFQINNHRYFTVEHVSAEEMVKLLNDVLNAFKSSFAEEVKLIPITRFNTLFAVSTSERLLDKLEGFIRQFDIPSDVVGKKIYIYSVKNGQAEEISDLLNTVLGNEVQSSLKRGSGTGSSTVADDRTKSGSAGSGQSSVSPTQTNPFSGSVNSSSSSGGASRISEKRSRGTKGTSKDQGESSILSSSVRVIPDEIRNVLIIEATPNDYRILEEILKRIDVLPRQVLIEVTIADVQLDDSTNLGIEWTYLKGEGDLSTSLLNAQMGAQGFSYAIGLPNRWTQTLATLAKENKVNILSTPTVLASDNKEAKINVSTEVPTASSEYQINTGSNGVLQTNIQYRNTGIILSVTPHINERGLVSMDISQEVSNVGDGVNVGGKEYPSFRKRTVNTNLTVNNGQTIVIGGLITEDKSKGGSGVPLLRDIPLLGFVFGTQKKSYIKSEMIVLITPRVVSGLEDVDSITSDFKKKVDELKKQK